MSFQNLFNRKPCQRCDSQEHTANCCEDIRALTINPSNDPLIWPNALTVTKRVQYEDALTKKRGVTFEYSGGLSLEEFRKRIDDRASTSAAGASSSATRATLAPGGNPASSSGTPSHTVAGSSLNIPIRSKTPGAPTVGGNQNKGSTANSTLVSTTPSGPSDSRPGTGRTLRPQSLILTKPQNQSSTPKQSVGGLEVDSKQFQGTLKQFQASNQSNGFPLRPDFATIAPSGTKILTNHFKVSLPKVLYRYTMGLTTGCASWSRGARKRLIEAFFEDTPFLQAQESNFATDSLVNIVSWKELEFDTSDIEVMQDAGKQIPPASDTDSLVFSKRVPFGSTRDESGAFQQKFELVAIYSHGAVDLKAFSGYVRSQTGLQKHDTSVACQSLNIIISKAAGAVGGNCESFQAGSNKFFLKRDWEFLGQSVVYHNGFSVTVKPGMGDVLLNVNTATSAFFEPCLVSVALRSCHPSTLKGLRVYVNYGPKQQHTKPDDHPSRVKTIKGFGLKSLREQFFKKDGKDVSVYDHLRDKYGLKALDRLSRCVNLGSLQPGKEVWFAPEMLQILPYQPYRAKLSPSQTDLMIRRACISPDIKVGKILSDGLCSMGFGPSPSMSAVLQSFSLDIDKRMLLVPSRCAPTVNLTFGLGKPVQVIRGSWYHNAQMLKTEKKIPGRFHYIFSDPTFVRELDSLHQGFSNALCRLGLNPVSSSYSVLQNSQESSFERELSQVDTKQVFLVIFLQRRKSVPEYASFKRFADNKGIQSLCLARLPNAKNASGYFRNVGMKVNLKLGNVNNSVQNYLGGGFGSFGRGTTTPINKNVMIFGADVTHPGAGSPDGTPSIAAVVGSVDGTFGRFPGSMRWQQPEQKSIEKLKKSKEIIDGMKPMARERLRAYWNENNNLPTHIVYYRDGVSEAQRADVKNHEVLAIKAAYQTVAQEHGRVTKEVPVTAVIVTKRHNTRLFPKEKSSDKRDKGNVFPGTIVDSCITSPYNFDFFMVSHLGIQGTARPAHYFVVENGMNFTAAQLQDFTQKLCATYVRADKTVSYASPAYYADRLCERGRAYVRDFLDGNPSVAGLDSQSVIHRVTQRWASGHNYWPQSSSLANTMFWM